MITNLQWLGIYPDVIDKAIDSAESAVSRIGKTDVERINLVDDLNDYALENLQNYGSFKDITNSIIGAYFDAAESMINDKKPKWEVSFYVNCGDSHFVINGEEV